MEQSSAIKSEKPEQETVKSIDWCPVGQHLLDKLFSVKEKIHERRSSFFLFTLIHLLRFCTISIRPAFHDFLRFRRRRRAIILLRLLSESTTHSLEFLYNRNRTSCHSFGFFRRSGTFCLKDQTKDGPHWHIQKLYPAAVGQCARQELFVFP